MYLAVSLIEPRNHVVFQEKKIIYKLNKNVDKCKNFSNMPV